MASDPSQPPVPEATLLLIGPFLVGALLSWLLFGISIVQLYIYHVSFRDRWAITACVYGVFLLDIWQSVVVAAATWEALVDGWGRPVNLRFPGWSFAMLPLVSSIIALWVQSFYAWRIWELSKWRFIPLLVLATAVAQAVAAWVISISFFHLNDVLRLHDPGLSISNIIWLGGSAFTDVVIMVTMLYLLYSVRQRTKQFERSEFIVRRLIRLTVETGLACAAAAVLVLALFLAAPSTNLEISISLILSKVYSNTLMTSLNSRANIAERRSTHHTTSHGANTMPFRHVNTRPGDVGEAEGRMSQGAVEIHISRVTEHDRALGHSTDKLPPGWDSDIEMNGLHSSPDSLSDHDKKITPARAV